MWGRPVHRRMVSSLPGFAPLGAGSNSPHRPLSYDTYHAPRHGQVSPRSRPIALNESPCGTPVISPRVPPAGAPGKVDIGGTQHGGFGPGPLTEHLGGPGTARRGVQP